MGGFDSMTRAVTRNKKVGFLFVYYHLREAEGGVISLLINTCSLSNHINL